MLKFLLRMAREFLELAEHTRNPRLAMSYRHQAADLLIEALSLGEEG